MSYRKLATRAALAMVAGLGTSGRDAELRCPNSGVQGRGERLTATDIWHRPALTLIDALVKPVEISPESPASL
jgi:hypothetical protein